MNLLALKNLIILNYLSLITIHQGKKCILLVQVTMYQAPVLHEVLFKMMVSVYMYVMMCLSIVRIYLNTVKKFFLEICAVQIENTGKRMVVICLYRSPSHDFKQFLKLLDLAFLSLNNPAMEVLICGDFNVDYLSNFTHKQESSIMISGFRRVLNIVCVLLGISPASV